MSEELQVVETAVTITHGANINEIAQRARLIDELYRKVLKKDVHYGIIPGTDKPTLYKAGSEKLLAVFNLGVEPIIEKTLLPEGHREYQVIANVKHYPTGRFIGGGVGACSTMESRYRYRNLADYEDTGEVIPADAKEKKKEYRKAGFGMKKVDGEWLWVKYGDSERSENPDVADVYNTCLKIAKKRAQIDAVLTVTGASDIFTQDIEDFAGMGDPTIDVPVKKEETVKRKYEVAGVDEWPEAIVDVQEKRSAEGKLYYVIMLENKKTCMTMSKELAEKAAAAGDGARVEVKPGRRPDSWVLVRVIEGEEPGAAMVAA